LIADSFKANRGSLPWPVEKGFISLGYGDQAHPIYNTLVIHNSGVEITTNEGATARAVSWRSSQYYGPVTGKQGGNDTTRDYFTIYQNLSSVSVNKGDKISIKQSLAA
jgi:murein DD-endopeptidase MepM/ murein hydrolase activator NlpD